MSPADAKLRSTSPRLLSRAELPVGAHAQLLLQLLDGVAARALLEENELIQAHRHEGVRAGDAVGIEAVAARQGVTPRSIQRLFEREGSTFSSFKLEHQLACARRMLSSRQYAGWTIGAVAFAAGFGDLSYFNRSFRRAFGATPSDIRAAARAPDGG